MNDYPDDESQWQDFEGQVLNHFAGIGKQRTILSGTWRKWMKEECAGTAWDCIAAWDNNDGSIHFTMYEPDGAESVHAIEKIKASRVHAARTFAALAYLYKNPHPIGLKEGYEVPHKFANVALYEELVCLGFADDRLIAEYQALGGEYREGNR